MFDTEEFTIFDLVDESQPFEPEFTEEEWNSFGFNLGFDDESEYSDWNLV